MPIISQLYSGMAKIAGKKSTIILIAFLLVVTGLRYLVVDIVIPKTAAFTTPFKWRNIPLREHRKILIDYFGKPVASETNTDKWPGGSKGKLYFLKVYYTSDSIATHYSIHYQYESRLWKKDYLIDSNSIR